jgi:hypothetical protein
VIDEIDAVCGSDNYYFLIRRKAVHLIQELVDSCGGLM